MTTEAPPPGSDGGEGGGATDDPFAKIREAGLDPDSVDWADLAAKAQYVDALTDPNRHFDPLESSLRQWGHLPEGSSLSDMFAADAEEVEDTPPWVQSQQAPEIVGYDAAGEPVFSQPPGQQNQPNFDPAQFAQQFEDRLLKNVDKRIEERTTAQQRENMAQRMVNDIEGQMEQVTSKYELNEAESSYLWNHVRSQIVTMDVQDPRQVKGLVDQAWQQIDSIANARLARLTDPNARRAPMTTDQSGPPPSRESQEPGQDAFGGMMQETARRLGLDGN